MPMMDGFDAYVGRMYALANMHNTCMDRRGNGRNVSTDYDHLKRGGEVIFPLFKAHKHSFFLRTSIQLVEARVKCGAIIVLTRVEPGIGPTLSQCEGGGDYPPFP